MRFFFIVPAVFLALAVSAQGAEKDIYSDCSVVEANETKSITCRFRPDAPKSVRKVGLLANGTPLGDVDYTPFTEGDGKAAWHFLIDRSNPGRSAAVARSVELVKQLYARSNARNLMSIASFAGEVQMHVSPGDPYVNVEERLSNVKADGAATAFYLAALRGIDLLEDVDAERRALVLISDGKAEDTAYNHADVVKRANQAGVVIYGIGLAERSSETVHLQSVERLASETGGPFVRAVGSDPLPEDFIEDFPTYLTNGGTVSAPVGDLSGEFVARVQVSFDDGTSAAGDVAQLYVEPPPPPPPPPAPEPEPVPEPEPLPLIGKIYGAFDPAIAGASEWAAANQGLAWALLFFPLFVILALIIFLVSRRREEDMPGEEDDDEVPATTATPPDELRTTLLSDGEVFGYFEVLDSGTRFEIREHNVTIGRHSENDFQIDDDTIHRHHAVFHISPDNNPVITDLDTVNGVIVNGKRIARTELQTDDIIELGETKIRFVAYESTMDPEGDAS